MPSAVELTKLYSKERHIEEFITESIREVELNARNGCKKAVIDVPRFLTRSDVEVPLKEAFPGCKVEWKWFIQCYKVSWV